MGAEPGQSISLVVQLTAPPPGVVPTNQPQPSVVPRSDDYHMPDMFTVEVGGERGHTKEVLVKVERTAVKKPFLGGYRHRVTGVEYHHASVQTMPKKRLDTGVRDAHMYVRGDQGFRQGGTKSSQQVLGGEMGKLLHVLLSQPSKYVYGCSRNSFLTLSFN